MKVTITCTEKEKDDFLNDGRLNCPSDFLGGNFLCPNNRSITDNNQFIPCADCVEKAYEYVIVKED